MSHPAHQSPSNFPQKTVYNLPSNAPIPTFTLFTPCIDALKCKEKMEENG